jgi:predicted nucleic acid-binding protein
MVLEVAVASGAEVIVTFNKKDFAKAEHFELEIYSPGEFLKSEGLL